MKITFTSINPSMIFAMVLVSVITTGCKIRLSTSGDGTINSVSGNFFCPANAFCGEVNVSTTEFDETFVAQPQNGSVFIGWRARNRGFCGGNLDECRLFTSGFVGNDTLLGFLDSDEVFFLEAVFQDDAGSGVGNASSCFNPDIYSVGLSARLVLRDTEDGETVQETLDFLNEPTTVNGVSAVRRVQNGSAQSLSGGGSEGLRGVETFILEGQRVRTLSETFEITGSEPRGGSEFYDPGRLDRFDLAAGDTFTQEYTIAETFSENGQTTSRSSEALVTIRFDGIESVTVPAGTFDACRFTETFGSEQSTFQIRDWIGVGTGVPLKSEDDSTLSELISGSINGIDI